MGTINVKPGNVDAVWKQYIPQASASNPITFQYSAGLYQTTGWKFQTVNTAGSYVTHQGAGIDRTIIQLVGSDGTPNTGIIFCGDWTWPSNWSCFDLTLDLNQPANGPRPAGGIYFWGADHVTIQRVKFVNFGSPLKGTECFPLIIVSPGRSGKNLIDFIKIDSCIFTNPVSGNQDGCSMIQVADNANGGVNIGPNCSTTNCLFLNCRSDFLYLHCVGNVNVQYNTAVNSGEFFYAEPNQAEYSGVQVTLDNNTISGGEALCSINPHPPNASIWIKIGVKNVSR